MRGIVTPVGGPGYQLRGAAVAGARHGARRLVRVTVVSAGDHWQRRQVKSSPHRHDHQQPWQRGDWARAATELGDKLGHDPRPAPGIDHPIAVPAHSPR